MDKLYSIKINKTGRYVQNCDKNWYETTGGPLYLWTKPEANAIAKQLRAHYVYDVTISNGDETYRHTLKGGNEQEVAVAVKPVMKKNFKITLKANK
jgi:hypothetical protein